MFEEFLGFCHTALTNDDRKNRFYIKWFFLFWFLEGNMFENRGIKFGYLYKISLKLTILHLQTIPAKTVFLNVSIGGGNDLQ